MNAREFLTSATIALAMMALATLIELAVPLVARDRGQRGRRATNLGLTALTLSFNGALTWGASVVALALSLGEPGVISRLGLPMGAQVALGFLVLDFSFGYLAHRALHACPMLWRAHRIHHSDPFVDVTTTFRNHPIEGLWRFLLLIVPIWTLGIPAEAVALQRLLTVVNGSLEHANIRLWRPLDRALALFWVTPDMHKVHHSRDRVETNSNYGNILSIYDRVFRTWTPPERALSVTYGLDDMDPKRASAFTKLLSMPFESTPNEQRSN